LLPEISEFLDIKDYTDLERLNSLIKNELACRKRDGDKFYTSSGFQSKKEKRMCRIAMEIFKNTATEVQNNVHLFDLFESDIILCIPSNGDSIDGNTDTIINIEVDGIHHKNEKKIQFCRRKDKYLKTKGVFVSRMNVSKMDRMKDDEIEEWMLKRVSLTKVEVSKKDTMKIRR
jgi:hypothetical protein